MLEVSERQPATIGKKRYVLLKELGQGGMATVYRAYDTRLQVWRAVKLLSPSYLKSSSVRARFDTEAQAMALLEHRNIVRVYDVDGDSQTSFLVMELVDGGSPIQWLEMHGAMPGRLAVRIVSEVCDGVAVAHEKGVIHRDIKPHNILFDREGVAKLTDFGIARVDDGDMSRTKTGAVMGTWGFMSPEQRADAKSVDKRGDIYALAATLYTLLTNRIPLDLFAADRDPRVLEDIPTCLRPVMKRATEYDRRRRYASIAEFQKALLIAAEELPEMPADTPALVRPGLASYTPPSHDLLARARPWGDAALAGGSPTLMPFEEAGFSDTPSHRSNTFGDDAPGASVGWGGGEEPTDVGARVPRGLLVPAIILASGAIMFAIAVLAWAVRSGPSPSDSGEPAPAVAEVNEPTEPIEAAPVTPETDEPAAVENETPTAEASPTTRPADPTPKGQTARRPDASKRPRESKGESKPIVGNAERRAASIAALETTTERPAVVTKPPVVKSSKPCIEGLNVTDNRPAKASVGIRFKLCDGVSDASILLHYRFGDSGAFTQKKTPFRLGYYRALLEIPDGPAESLQYYFQLSTGSYGSANSPKRYSLRADL